jgi:hypothetical protein
MARPAYETAEDRRIQTEIAKAVAARWKCEIKMTPPGFHAYDGIAYRESKPVGIVEIKNRPGVTRRTYPNYMIGKGKIERLVAIAKRNKVKPVLVVGLDDWIMGHGLQYRETWLEREGGRTDRGDAQDIEPCYLIPWDQFYRIKKKDLIR